VAGFDGAKTVRVSMSFFGDEVTDMQRRGRRDAELRETQR